MAKTTWVVHTDGRRYRWKPWLHPRDRKGQFIETFAEVRTIAGMLGRVIGRGSRNGTVRVRRHRDRKEFDVPSNMLEVLRRPSGKRPTPKQSPDVGELRSTRTRTPTAPRGMRGAQENNVLAEWDSDGLRNHLAKMFRSNSDDLDDRYALGVAQWALFKDGRDRDDIAEIDRVIDDAREAAGLRRTPGDDDVRAMMGQVTDDVWKAETGRPFRANAWHRTDTEAADSIRSRGFDPVAVAATDQIFGSGIYLSLDDATGREASASLETREGYEERVDAVVNLRNPLVIEGVEDYDEDEVMWGDTIDVLVADALGITLPDLNERVTGNPNKPPGRGQLRQYLARDFDGIIYRERDLSGMFGTQAVVFDREAVTLRDDEDDDVTDFRVTQLEPKGDVEVGALVEESRVTPMRVADMPASAQEKLQAFVDNYGIDTKAIEDEFYEALQNEEYRKFGAIWYREEMQATAKRIAEATRGMKHPVSWQDALALVAIFSARNTWEGKNGNRWNEIHATRLAMAYASGAFDGLTARQVMDRADPKVTDRDSPDFWEFGYIRDKGFGLNGAALLLGEMNRDEALGKAKRKSFYSNGLEPDSNEDVTIDVWMANPLARYSTSNRTIQQWQSALSSGDPPKYLADLGIDASPVYMLMAEIVRRAHERGVADGLWDEGSVPSYTQAAAWIQQQVFERRGT